MWFLYYAAIYILVLGIRIASLWNAKSRAWIKGRKGWKKRLENLPSKNAYRIWFHVSSLGEFEQAKPVIETIKMKRPEVEIILSFFSPSGYNAKAGYAHAEVHYLPPDLPGHAALWANLIKPDLAVFVKYDLWPGYLRALHDNGIPAILISAHWSSSKKFSSWSLPLTSTLLKKFQRIFFQRPAELEYFSEKGFQNITVAGDTRIDRCLLLAAEAGERLPKEILAEHPFDIVAGSTWPQDEELIIEAIRQRGLRAIIAPHDVSYDNIRRLVSKFTFPSQLLSDLNNTGPVSGVIVVDSIGLLPVLYAVGKVAYVGGGFGRCIHNILEPAAHGKPVIFGPHYDGFPEAIEMIKLGCARSVKDKVEFMNALSEFSMDGKFVSAGRI